MIPSNYREMIELRQRLETNFNFVSQVNRDCKYDVMNIKLNRKLKNLKPGFR